MAAKPDGAGIEVTVSLFDHLRDRTGQAHLQVRLAAGATVASLLRHLAETRDPRFAEYDTGPAREPAIATLILNGQTLRIPQDLDHPLKTGDTLHLIPPIAGG
jgi:molybdopterin converting factor small subunit